MNTENILTGTLSAITFAYTQIHAVLPQNTTRGFLLFVGPFLSQPWPLIKTISRTSFPPPPDLCSTLYRITGLAVYSCLWGRPNISDADAQQNDFFWVGPYGTPSAETLPTRFWWQWQCSSKGKWTCDQIQYRKGQNQAKFCDWW